MSTPKKIRLMLITHDLAIGGLQKVVVNICRHIDRERFHVSVLCLRDFGEFTEEVERMGIKVYRLPQMKRTDYLSFIKVAHILRREKIDVIHTHNTQPFVDGTLASFMSGVSKIVHTDHGRGFPDKRRYMIAEWAMSHFATRVVGVSEHTTADLRKYEKISQKKLMTIANGVSRNRSAALLNHREKRRELGITQKGPIIGVATRLSREKGVTNLLQAMPDIARRIPDVSLVVAGKGGLLSQLEAEAQMLGISDRVYFTGPILDIPELIGLFDVCVLPSLREGQPMVISEAMAGGCPVIASNVGGVPSIIRNGVNGSLVAPGKPEEIASEAVKLLKDSALLEYYRENGRRLFEKYYSAERMVDCYEKLYRLRS